jgi:HTH-type transcriptional regulator, sugar sensing transcriptional regulator
MDSSIIIDKLVAFGLTRQEANLYLCLLNNTELSGYEVAKQTGISRSNVYSGLNAITEKGAAYLLEGNTNRYVAVPIKEFCVNVIHTRQEDQKYLEKHIQISQDTSEGYITIEGYKNILNKIHYMLHGAEKRIYLSTTIAILKLLQEDIRQIVKNDIKVVLVTDQEPNLEGTTVYITKGKENQIRLIMDSKYVLTGDISFEAGDTCLYSGQINFVNVFKEALRNEIKLIELMKGKMQDE